MRSIAVVMATAWLIGLVERKGRGVSLSRINPRSPVVLSVLALVAVSILSTLTSVSPRASFLGSCKRMGGAYSTLCFILIFAMILLEMRGRERMRRLVMTIIPGSLPVCLYGIFQKTGMDPLAWDRDVILRTPSSMGNPIFAAAYLLMVSLLTWGKLAGEYTEMRRSGHTRILPMVLYGLMALLQCAAIGFADSRGPLSGWLGGLFLFALLLAALSRRRYAVSGVIASGALGLLFLSAVNVFQPALSSPRDTALLGSASRLFDGETGTGKVRALIREGIRRMMLPHEPISFPCGHKDQLNELRPFIGYGPESVMLVFPQFFPPELAHHESRTSLVDRSHNEAWEALATTGLLGLAASQALFFHLFRLGLEALGFVSGRREKKRLLWLWLGMGAAGILASLLSGRPNFSAVGLTCGNAAGMAVHIAAAFAWLGTEIRLSSMRPRAIMERPFDKWSRRMKKLSMGIRRELEDYRDQLSSRLTATPLLP